MTTKNLSHASNEVTESSPHHHPINNWDKPFWRSVSSSEYGTGSTSRISTLAIIATTLSVVIYLVIKNGDIPSHLIELGMFSALLITAVYSPAKLASIFKSFFARK